MFSRYTLAHKQPNILKDIINLMSLFLNWNTVKLKNSLVNWRVNTVYAAALCVQTPNGEESM